ncbi:hypothetical protein BGW80DRAFT_1362973, partial [Lactifluus volemus]
MSRNTVHRLSTFWTLLFLTCLKAPFLLIALHVLLPHHQPHGFTFMFFRLVALSFIELLRLRAMRRSIDVCDVTSLNIARHHCYHMYYSLYKYLNRTVWGII